MITIEGLRQFRLGDYAIFDMALAFVGMGLLSPVLSKLFRFIKLEIPRKIWLIWTLPISILIHLLIGQMTLMTKRFLNLEGDYLLKALVIILIIFGLRGIKKIK